MVKGRMVVWWALSSAMRACVSLLLATDEFPADRTSVCLGESFGFGGVRQATRRGDVDWGYSEIDGDGASVVGGRRAQGDGNVGWSFTGGGGDKVVGFQCNVIRGGNDGGEGVTVRNTMWRALRMWL
jgi:hypothetical protein